MIKEGEGEVAGGGYNNSKTFLNFSLIRHFLSLKDEKKPQDSLYLISNSRQWSIFSGFYYILLKANIIILKKPTNSSFFTSCEVDAFPPNVTYYWYQGDTLISCKIYAVKYLYVYTVLHKSRHKSEDRKLLWYNH